MAIQAGIEGLSFQRLKTRRASRGRGMRAFTRGSIIAGGLFASDLAAFLLCLAAFCASGARMPAVLQPWLVCILVGVLLHFVASRHYRRRLPGWYELSDVITASFAAGMATLVIGWLLAQLESGLELAAIWLAFPAVVAATRKFARSVMDRAGIWQVPVLFIGGRASDRAMAAVQSDPAVGYRIAGIAPPEALRRGGRRLLLEYGADMILLAGDFWESTERATLEKLLRDRVPFAVAPRTEGLPVLGYEETCFIGHEVVLHRYHNNLAKPARRALKIAFDLVAASVLAVLLLPLLLAIAALVRLDGGPALFGHERIGAGGNPFSCLKFRTMLVDADAVLNELLATDPAAAAEWTATQKLRDDPRITWIGRVLRRTSLDELPQLLNVLRLEMSLVGPRPIVRREIPRYAEDIAYYYETRPGITGLWQVSGRNNTSYSHRVELDRWYAKNWTLWQDLTILLRTVPAVLAARGAC